MLGMSHLFRRMLMSDFLLLADNFGKNLEAAAASVPEA